MRALLLLLLLLGVPARAGFEEGVDAYLRGDYDRAASEWRPLAARGHAQAAFNLGRMRELGQGNDERDAAFWYREAAERGHPEAQRALGQLLAEGDAGSRGEAAFWLALAARAWPADSPARRYVEFQLDRLRAGLDAAAFAEAEARADSWSPRRD